MRSSEKLFDVVLGEYLFDFECYLPIAEKLNVPIIATVTLHSLQWADHNIGIPNNPAVMPSEFDSSSLHMSLVERIRNVWNYIIVDYHSIYIRERIDEFYHQHFAEELLYKKSVSMIFYNNHPSLLPRPYVPNAIDIGGIHVNPARPLPKVSLLSYCTSGSEMKLVLSPCPHPFRIFDPKLGNTHCSQIVGRMNCAQFLD